MTKVFSPKSKAIAMATQYVALAWKQKLTGFEPGVNCKTKSPHIEKTEINGRKAAESYKQQPNAQPLHFSKVSRHQLDEGRQQFEQQIS
jgi:hypothetical protein